MLEHQFNLLLRKETFGYPNKHMNCVYKTYLCASLVRFCRTILVGVNSMCDTLTVLHIRFFKVATILKTILDGEKKPGCMSILSFLDICYFRTKIIMLFR